MSDFDQNSLDDWTDEPNMHDQIDSKDKTRRIGGEEASPKRRAGAPALPQAPQPAARKRRSDRHQPEGAPTPSPKPAQRAGAGVPRDGQETIVTQRPPGRQARAPQPMSNSQVQQQLYGQGRPMGPGVNQVQQPPRQEKDERVVAKRRSQPVPAYLQEQKTQPVKTKKKPLSIIVIVLLIIGFFVVGFALLPQRDTGFLGTLNKAKQGIITTVNQVLGNTRSLLTNEEPEPLAVKKFIASSNNGQAPIDVGFTITTSKSVQGVRLATSLGYEIETKGEPSVSDNEDSKIWSVTVAFTEAFSDGVKVHIFDGEIWYDSGTQTQLTITAPVTQVWDQAGVVTQATQTPPPATTTPEPIATQPPQDNQGADQPGSQDQAGSGGEPTANTGADTFGGGVSVQETAIPTQQAATPEPTASPSPTPTLEPTAVPDPTNTPMPYMAAAPVEGTSPDQVGLTTKVYEGSKSTESFARAKEIQMSSPDEYSKFDNGVLTFRGGPFRQNAAFGKADIQSGTMDIAWSVPVGSIEAYSGIYWTGQPAIIQWPKQIREMMKINEEKINKSALREVIIGAQDGKIYFVDLADGEATREPIDTGYPLRSSITVHPNSYPLMTVGQGISKLKKATGKIGYHIYNLIDHKQLLLINGRDDDAFGSNGAMDGTPIIDRNSDTMIFAGENGLLYTVELNAALVMKDEQAATESKITIDPKTVKYRFKAKNQKNGDTGVETSVAMYGAYAYFADGAGVLQCVDTNTMKPVWAVKTDDNTDATLALDFDEDGTLGLYTVNMLEKQGKKGTCTIRRLDAMTGQQVWSVAVEVKYDAKEPGGGKASPVVGKGSIDNMVIFTIAKTTETEGKGGQILALDKKTGNKIWTSNMEAFSWSSPVAVYNEQGKAWIVQGDSKGNLHLLDGENGNVLSTLALEGEIMASPAVYDDTLVIGTTGKDTSYIYGVKLN